MGPPPVGEGQALSLAERLQAVQTGLDKFQAARDAGQRLAPWKLAMFEEVQHLASGRGAQVPA